MWPRTLYNLYIDESGTHDLRSIDPIFPVFVLVGLLVGEAYYARTLVPHMKILKRRFGIALEMPLHSRDIRRHEGAFRFLADEGVRNEFYASLNDLFSQSRLRIYAVVIRKRELAGRFIIRPNPYDISLSQLLSIVCGAPRVVGVNRPSVKRIVAERRGKLEDRALQSEYQRFRKSGLPSYDAPDVQSRRPQTVGRLFPFRIDFATKRESMAGLELADLAAYPIGRAYANRDLAFPPFRVLAPKIRQIVIFP